MPESSVRELRLALVCYGGSSLAVYMHGVTKELQRLVVASRAFERDPVTNPFPAGRSEHAWWLVLSRLHAAEAGAEPRAGTLLRVVVDIVSGTSAGGINGIALAKALATNREQDELTGLWLERAAVGQLVDAPRWLPGRIGLAWALARCLVGWRSAPLRGEALAGWLHDGFERMDRGAEALPGAWLVPPGHTLRLHVPVTDFHGYDRRLPVDGPPRLLERRHRHVLVLTHPGGARGAGPEGGALSRPANHALAFAARATSSIPGAFAPARIADYAVAVAGGVDVGDVARGHYRAYTLAGAAADQAFFVDGGMLDNRPFRSAVEAIPLQPAGTEVDRRLLYVEPDPREEGARPTPGRSPTWPAALWGSFVSIPRKEPILDDLAALGRRNDDVRSVRDVIETSFPDVRARVRELAVTSFGWASLDQPPGAPGPDELRRWHAVVEDDTRARSGFSHATYQRLRLRGAIDDYAAVIARVLDYPPASDQAAVTRGVLLQAAAADGVLARRPDDAETSAQRAFLERFDLGYHDRRLRFLVAALSWWYRDCGRPGFPRRDQLDDGKQRLYDLLGSLWSITERLRQDSEVAAAAAVLGEDRIATTVPGSAGAYDRFFATHAGALRLLRDRVAAAIDRHLPALEQALYGTLRDLATSWAAFPAGELMVRYLGFPYWDVLTYPVTALSGVSERDHVEVVRISPRDSRLLGEDDPGKLSGASLGHFGAFFTRAGRERDYLWGRLDAAERLCGVVLGGDGDGELTGPGLEACRTVLATILDEERAALPRARDLIGELERRLGALAAGQASPPSPIRPGRSPSASS